LRYYFENGIDGAPPDSAAVDSVRAVR
jgi:hypothetical protein